MITTTQLLIVAVIIRSRHTYENNQPRRVNNPSNDNHIFNRNIKHQHNIMHTNHANNNN